VDCFAALRAQRDEIVLRITSGLASLLDVMDFDFCGAAADLTAPAIAFKHTATELLIGNRVQPKARAFLQAAPIPPGLPRKGTLASGFGKEGTSATSSRGAL
jgi:hypothetical protein